MTVTDSRLGPGTLVLGTLNDAGCQMSNVRLVPNHTDTDGTPTLCEPKPAPLLETDWSLQGTAIQDFELASAEGFQEYCRIENGNEVSFTWTPNTTYGTTTPAAYSGVCQIRAVEIGGDIGTQITTDFEFPVVGTLSRQDAVNA